MPVFKIYFAHLCDETILRIVDNINVETFFFDTLIPEHFFLGGGSTGI
jgi:hypothetical protein